MNEKEALPVAEKNEIIVYQPEGSEFHIEARVENETVWLTQAQMAKLFNSTRNNITLHIKNIFQEHELDASSVCKESLLTADDGKKYKTKNYNLDVIISVGYRVKSIQGTHFRQWALQILKEHVFKGFSVNQRLISHENRLEDLDSRVIDPFANDMVLPLMAKRAEGVNATIYTARITHAMREEEAHLNRQFPTVKLLNMREVHDRFVIVDDEVYHVGASFKDLGNQMTVFSVLYFITKEQVLATAK